MRKLLSLAVPVGAALIVAGLLLPPASAVAQPPTTNDLRENIDDMTRLDPDLEKYMPRWKILEANLKIKLATIFRGYGYSVSEGDSMVVVASFVQPGRAQELLTIRVGDTSKNAVINGSRKLQNDLGDGLYREILLRNYAHAVIEPARPVTSKDPERVPDVLNPVNSRQFIAVSAFKQTVQIGTTGARIEHMLGNDEIGYHFWSSGQGKASLKYPIIELDNGELRSKGVPDILTVMLGAGYRLKFGGPEDSFLSGTIPARLLNGSLGGKAIARVDYRPPVFWLSTNSIFGMSLNTEVPFGKLEERGFDADQSVVWFPEAITKRGSLPDTGKAAYFLRNVVQGTVFWETWLNDYEHFFRFSVGMSYQDYARGFLGYLDGAGKFVAHTKKKPAEFESEATVVNYENGGIIHPTTAEDWVMFKVDYLNQSGFPFGLSAQLANQNLMISGFIPLFPNWLFIEAKYSTPLLREQPAPWEQRHFFMISPILRFKIDMGN